MTWQEEATEAVCASAIEDAESLLADVAGMLGGPIDGAPAAPELDLFSRTIGCLGVDDLRRLCRHEAARRMPEIQRALGAGLLGRVAK